MAARSPNSRRTIAAVALGLGAIAAALLGGHHLFSRVQADVRSDVKSVEAGVQALVPGGKPQSVALRGMVLVHDPLPHIVRALRPDGQLLAGESLTLRARISSPAYLTLLAQKPGGAAEPIWPSLDAIHKAGEFELDEGESPLVLDPGLFGSAVELALIACPAPLGQMALRTRAPLTTEESAAQAFPSCTTAVLGPISRAAAAAAK